MGSGLPSLVPAAGGVLEFSEHGRNAWLIAPDSTDSIVDGLGRLLSDAPLRRRLAAGALETARERGWDKVYERLLADYQETVEGKGIVRAAWKTLSAISYPLSASCRRRLGSQDRWRIADTR